MGNREWGEGKMTRTLMLIADSQKLIAEKTCARTEHHIACLVCSVRFFQWKPLLQMKTNEEIRSLLERARALGGYL